MRAILILAVLSAIAVALVGCTLNVYVLPGVKTDLRWPATQPIAEPDRPDESRDEDHVMPDSFAKFRYVERPKIQYRVNLDDPDAAPQFACGRQGWINSELTREEFRRAAQSGRFVEDSLTTESAN